MSENPLSQFKRLLVPVDTADCLQEVCAGLDRFLFDHGRCLHKSGGEIRRAYGPVKKQGVPKRPLFGAKLECEITDHDGQLARRTKFTTIIPFEGEEYEDAPIVACFATQQLAEDPLMSPKAALVIAREALRQP